MRRAKKDFYAFPVEVLGQLGLTTTGELYGFDAMLETALRYAIYRTYMNYCHGNPAEFDSEAFAATVAALGLGDDTTPAAIEWARDTFNNYRDSKVITSISRRLFWEIQANAEARGDFYMMQAAAALALRSILGAFSPKVAKGVTWDFMLSRMAGKAKKVKKYPKHVKRYATRKMRLKLIKALCEYWGFEYYAPRGTRVPLFGWGMTADELAEYAKQQHPAKRKKQGTSI